jgi:TolB protein
MLVCSDVSKDGSKILLTMAPEGHADIYELDLASKSKKRVTKFKGIDVNGRYIDDESKIVFISNRLGYANVFKKSIKSAAASQVVYHGRNNNACDAYGDKIVYSSRESNRAFGDNTFNLYLASSGSSDTRPITTTGSNQFPRFSSDGSVILFLKQRGHSSSIGYINLGSQQSLLFPFNDRKVQSIDW